MGVIWGGVGEGFSALAPKRASVVAVGGVIVGVGVEVRAVAVGVRVTARGVGVIVTVGGRMVVDMDEGATAVAPTTKPPYFPGCGPPLPFAPTLPTLHC